MLLGEAEEDEPERVELEVDEELEPTGPAEEESMVEDVEIEDVDVEDVEAEAVLLGAAAEEVDATAGGGQTPGKSITHLQD